MVKKKGKLSKFFCFIEVIESEYKLFWSKFDDLFLEEKWEFYKCGLNYVMLKDI